MSKLSKKELELIQEFEYIIGSNCYNPKSVDGYTGQVGKEYRYAAYYQKNRKDTDLTKEKEKIKDLSSTNVDTVRYVFGANHLYIGKALVDIIEYLKSEYDLDFDELEKIKLKKRKEKMKIVAKELKMDGFFEMYEGVHTVGIDLPEGKYILSSDDDLFLSVKRFDNTNMKNISGILDSTNPRSVGLFNGDTIYADGVMRFTKA